MTSKERLPEVTYASPQSFLTRSVSKESENSEGRRIGRPLSMPPIDYKLPRASLTPSSGAPRNEKQPRKAIRTPSGRSMSAMEYLRGGYRPSEKSLPEEEKGKGFFFDAQ